MTDYLANPLAFLIHFFVGGYVLLLVLRYLLTWRRIPPNNQIFQFLFSLTQPLLRPMRRVIPGYAGIDVSSLLAIWLLKVLELQLLLLLYTPGLQGPMVLLWALPELVQLLFYIYIGALLLHALLSWFAPPTGHPAISAINLLVSPLYRRIRRFVPVTGSIDLGPLLLIVILIVSEMLVTPPLKLLLSSPF